MTREKLKAWCKKALAAVLAAFGAIALWRLFGDRSKGMSKGIGVDNETSITGWQKAPGDTEKPTVTAPIGQEEADAEIRRIDSELARRK